MTVSSKNHDITCRGRGEFGIGCRTIITSIPVGMKLLSHALNRRVWFEFIIRFYSDDSEVNGLLEESIKKDEGVER
jgi:hypothetical protein